MLSKKVIPLMFTCALLTPLGQTPAQAQISTDAVQLGQWNTWNNVSTGYTMKLPKGFKLANKTRQTWRFNGSEMSLNAVYWRSPKWKHWQVAKRAYSDWKTLSNKSVEKETDISRYITASKSQGTMLEGTGIQSNRVVRFVIVGLHNPYNGINHSLRFAWWNDPQDNARHEKAVERVLESIRPYSSNSNPYGKDPFKDKPVLPQNKNPFKDDSPADEPQPFED